jgi:hypothetical protein
MMDASSAAENTFHGLVRVLDSFTIVRRKRLETTRRLIARLSDEWVAIRRKELERNVRENHHFNPLRGITIKETDHSRILGGLLDPRGSHGQNSLFLYSFLKQLKVEPQSGTWHVTIESGRVDILLRRVDTASVVIIENKANSAQDQDGQLYRYWFHEIHSRHEHLNYHDPDIRSRFRVVYLPPGGHARPAERSLIRPLDPAYASCPHPSLPMTILDCRSFKFDVAVWLREMANQNQNLSTRLKTFLNLYAEIWSL